MNDHDMRATLRLWGAVLRQGVADFCIERRECRKGEAHLWFWDDTVSCGSFVWCCQLFDIDPDKARAQTLNNWREVSKLADSMCSGLKRKGRHDEHA